MDAKFSLALIALVGVGVFALPSTMSLFAGQHSFYNIDATGNQVPCQKCHGDVQAELGGSDAKAGSKAPHADFKCEYCHRSEAGMASGDDAYAKISYSAAPATGTLYLVTTIQNFETGNFPKELDYNSATTVDNWVGYNLGGTTAFANKTEYLDSAGKYAGKLGAKANSDNARYKYSYGSEVSTRVNDVIKNKIDTTTTKDQAFNPRAVTIDGAGNVDLAGAGSGEVTPGTRYHAASLVSCLECHGGEKEKGAAGYEIETGEPYNHANWLLDATNNATSSCSNCHYSGAAHTPAFEHEFAAGGFRDLTTGLGLTEGGTEEGAVEAHNAFVSSPSTVLRSGPGSDGGYGAANIACVACHTHVPVDINFVKKYKVKFTANEDSNSWIVNGFSTEGKVDVSVYGNSDGSVFATDNKKITWTPTGDQLYINGTDAPVIGLSNDATDNKAALTT